MRFFASCQKLNFYLIRYSFYVQNSEIFEQNWPQLRMYFLYNCNHEKFTGRIFEYFLMRFFASCQKLNLDLMLLKEILCYLRKFFNNVGHFMTNFRPKCHFRRQLDIKWQKISIIKTSFSNIRSKLSFWRDAKRPHQKY